MVLLYDDQPIFKVGGFHVVFRNVQSDLRSLLRPVTTKVDPIQKGNTLTQTIKKVYSITYIIQMIYLPYATRASVKTYREEFHCSRWQTIQSRQIAFLSRRLAFSKRILQPG